MRMKAIIAGLSLAAFLISGCGSNDLSPRLYERVFSSACSILLGQNLETPSQINEKIASLKEDIQKMKKEISQIKQLPPEILKLRQQALELPKEQHELVQKYPFLRSKEIFEKYDEEGNKKPK